MTQREEPQVAWMAIEDNAQVFSTEGEAVGKVSQVVGDAEADVFSGLAIALRPMGRPRFVSADCVRAIWPDRIELDVTRDQVESLPEHKAAPTERIQPGDDGFMARVRRFFGGGGRPRI